MRAGPSDLPTPLQLIVFATVVRSESIARATEELGYLNSSSVIYHIRSLEQLYGVELFVHGKRRLRLTEAGKLLYALSSDVITRLRECEAAMASLGQETGHLILGGPAARLELMYSLLGWFRIERPTVRVNIATFSSTDEVEQALWRGEIDVGILRRPPLQRVASCRTTHLKERVFVVASTELIVGKDAELTREELSRLSIIVPRMNPETYVVFTNLVREHGISFASMYDAFSLKVVKQMVLAGKGVSLVPWSLVTTLFQNSSVKLLRVSDADLNQDIVLARPRSQPDSPWQADIERVLRQLLDPVKGF